MVYTRSISTGRAAGMAQRWQRFLDQLRSSENAAISPMMALMMIPISGSIAYAVELGAWQYVQRSAQNAADAAAIAAASNNSTTGTTFLMEARAAAQPYGYVNGVNNVQVQASKLLACPAGTPSGSTCYEAIVNTEFPLSFSRLLGFTGSAPGGGQLISAKAVATAKGGGGTAEICAWSLSNAANSFTSNGGPNPNMTGCSLMSNGGMSCTGHDLNADYGIAAGTNDTNQPCGNNPVSGATPLSDPYDAKKSNIPTTAAPACSTTFHQLTGNGNNKTVDPANRITGTPAWSGTQRRFCGDVQLTGDVTLTGTTALVIENGRLDLNGYTLRTGTGAAATIIFTGVNNATYHHYPMSTKNTGAVLDLEAPNSGTWSGVAIYQDPALTTNVSFSNAGNNPTWNITGLVYLPKADIGFSGIVNKAADGVSCFVLVAYTIATNGTAQIFANTQCASAGLGTPSVTVGTSTREKLVL